MDLRRILFAFSVAALLAGVCTYLLYGRLRVTTAQAATVKVVAASEALPQGTTLTAKNVILLDWPADLPLADSFNKFDDVVGRPLISSVGAKEPILKRDLGIQGSGIGLSGKIPAGMRATAVKSNEIVGVAGFLYPGSRVDVLATYAVPTPNGGPPRMLTQTLLQDVEVLAAGQTIEPDPQGKPETVNVVTLLLNPEDSQKLLLTSGQGTIQFVLRSGVDETKVKLRPTKLDQLVESDIPAPAAAGKGIRSGSVTKSAALHPLEMIQGTQRTIHKF